MNKSDQYRFAKTVDSNEKSSGYHLPHRLQAIERFNVIAGKWEKVGYVEIHLHRVLRDERDLEDISVGITVRINRKVQSTHTALVESRKTKKVLQEESK